MEYFIYSLIYGFCNGASPPAVLFILKSWDNKLAEYVLVKNYSRRNCLKPHKACNSFFSNIIYVNDFALGFYNSLWYGSLFFMFFLYMLFEDSFFGQEMLLVKYVLES